MSAQCLSQPDCPVAATTFCDTTGNNTYYWNNLLFIDPVLQSHDLGEVPTDLSVQITDNCGTGEVQASFVLLLDLNGDGVRETAVSSQTLPGTALVYYGNAVNPGYTGGEARQFDTRPVPTDEKYEFALEKTEQAGQITARVRWTNALHPSAYVLPELPNGAHRIEWRFEKNGEVRTCAYDFVVKDCQPPTVTCGNGLSINILPASLPAVQVGALNFAPSSEDNYTPSNYLQYGIRRAGAGTGFPTAPYAVFNCQDLGTQPVEIWAKDLAGNAGFCTTSVIVQDNAGACVPINVEIDVCTVNHCTGVPIPNVEFSLSAGNPGLSPTIFLGTGDSTGCFSTIASVLPATNNFTIVPFIDGDPLNGVTTQDLILIQRHILGLEPLVTYNLLAADINKSGSITSLDVVELHKLIVGIYQEFPNNTSWRFVDSSFVFPDPSNPFGNPGGIMQAGSNRFFYGVKVGDVNCTALQPLLEPANEEVLTIPDLYLSADTIVEVPIHFLRSNFRYYGLQFGLQFDSTRIEVLDVTPNTGPGDDNSAIFPDHVNFSRSKGAMAIPTYNQPIYRLRIKTRTDVHLAELFSLNTNLTAEAYPKVDSLVRLVLQVGTVATTEPSAGQQILAPEPNPTAAGVRIPLHLAQDKKVNVEILDITGRLLYQQRQVKEPGKQWLEVPATVFPQAGVYFWRVQAGTEYRTGKIVKQ